MSCATQLDQAAASKTRAVTEPRAARPWRGLHLIAVVSDEDHDRSSDRARDADHQADVGGGLEALAFVDVGFVAAVGALLSTRFDGVVVAYFRQGTEDAEDGSASVKRLRELEFRSRRPSPGQTVVR